MKAEIRVLVTLKKSSSVDNKAQNKIGQALSSEFKWGD